MKLYSKQHKLIVILMMMYMMIRINQLKPVTLKNLKILFLFKNMIKYLILLIHLLMIRKLIKINPAKNKKINQKVSRNKNKMKIKITMKLKIL